MDAGSIINSINAIAEKIFKSVEGEVFNNLDELLIVSEDILEKEPLKNLFTQKGIDSFGMLTTSFIIFFCTYYVITRIISMYNGQESQSAWKYILCTTICVIISSSSLFVCKQVLTINGIFSDTLKQIGETLTKKEICFASLKEVVVNLNEHMTQDFLSVDGLIRGVISFGAVTLLVNLSIRYVTIIFLLLASPLGIILASSNYTYGVFNMWLKMLIKNLLVQHVIILILVIPLAFKNPDNSMYKIILVGSIYLLYRINNFTGELFSQIASKR